jgi:hypothetical protein
MRKTSVLILAAPLAFAAPAQAQTTAAARPDVAGKASHIAFAIDGTAAPISSRVPSALSMKAPAGFTFDRAAAPKRCAHTQAALNECPAASQIGTGSLVINVTYQGRSRNVTFHLKIYLRSAHSLFGVTFLAGTRVVPGTLVAGSGIGVVFNPLPAPPVFAQVTYALRRITLNLGATRRIVTPVTRTTGTSARGKSKVTVVDLIHNPRACTTGSWPATMSLSFPDGTTTQLSAAIACRP